MLEFIAGDAKLNYIEQGDGEYLIFVHGSVSDYRTWQHQQEKFSPYYRTIAYSRRFHWPNERISEGQDYSMQQHVNDLEVFITQLGKPVHLVGHSYGAFIGLVLAIQSPQLLLSLVLAEPPVITLFVSNKPKPSELLKVLFTKPKTAIALIKFGATGMEPATKEVKRNNMAKAIEIFGKATLGVQAYTNLSAERTKQVNQNLIKAEFLGSGFPPLDEQAVRNINIPILLLTAQNSPKLFQLLLHRLGELLLHAEKETISASSHIMHEDNAAEYNKIVLAFISKVSKDLSIQ